VYAKQSVYEHLQEFYAKQSVYEHHQEFIEQSEAEPQSERTFIRKDKAAYRGYIKELTKPRRKTPKMGKAVQTRCKVKLSTKSTR
jgi:uncharacterized protein (DUF1778 family)